MDFDVLVIGAGLAGLVAARDLSRGGRTVRVLEARDRVGGRTLNADLGDGQVVEVGGQWVGPQQTALLELAAELDVPTFATYGFGDNLLEWDGRVRRYTRTIPRLNPMVLADVAQAQARTERMARTVPLEAPWRAARAERWDGQTLESWLRRNVRTEGARELMRLGVEAVFAADASELSLLHVLFYLHSGDGGTPSSERAAARSRTASSAAPSGCRSCSPWTSMSRSRHQCSASRRRRTASRCWPAGTPTAQRTSSSPCPRRSPGASTTSPP